MYTLRAFNSKLRGLFKFSILTRTNFFFLVLLKQNFGKNNDGQYDLRIINSFKLELDNLFSNNNYPLILICSSNIQDLPSELSRLFLEIIEIKAPNSKERCEMLKWILKCKNLRYKFDLNELANKTNGFLLEDLKALTYYAQKTCTEKKPDKRFVKLKGFEDALGKQIYFISKYQYW